MKASEAEEYSATLGTILGLMRKRAEAITVAQFVETLRGTGKTQLADEIERILADDMEQALQLLHNYSATLGTILGLMRKRAEAITVAQFVETLRSTGKTQLADEIERILADDAEQELQLINRLKEAGK